MQSNRFCLGEQTITSVFSNFEGTSIVSRRWLDFVLDRNPKQAQRLTRRQLMQLGFTAAAGLLSSGGASAKQSARQRPRIVVIGAGFSGLACAYELASVGYDVKVLESRSRVGGRVQTLRELIPGKNVEGGGEMLGSNHPCVLAYAAKFGFEFLDVSKNEAGPPPIILGGRKLRGQEVEQISLEIDEALGRMTDDARPVLVDQPWKTPNAEQLDRTTTADWINNLNMSPLAKALITLQFTGNNGVSTDRQSYLGNLAQVCGGGLERYWTDTEVYRLKGGNQLYAERLAKELGPDRVLLNCAVREVNRSDASVTVVDADGRKHQADEIVLTVPPSVWSRMTFSPELPELLRPQMGMNVKYLAVVKERFFQALKLPPSATTDQDITQVWEGTDGQAAEGPAAMVAFSGGPAAERNHQRPVAERRPAYLNAFEILFPGFKEQFVKGQFMDWIGDPWSRAGYSFPAPGQVTTNGPLLRSGLGKLHFAGEHTCYPFVGYMEGALSSGAALAKRIATRDGIVPRN